MAVSQSGIGSLRVPSARFGRWQASELAEIVNLTDQPDRLDGGGWWAVMGTFEGEITGYRFKSIHKVSENRSTSDWKGPLASEWSSSIDEPAYLAAVQAIFEYIAAGDVYQVNLCRMLTASLPGPADPYALAAILAAGNPAPYAGVLDLGDDWIVSASPELFLSRDGNRIVSSPIKGTTKTKHPFADKDYPENVMICDLVRNDLGRVARPGSVVVTELLRRQEHPGLSHLVSTIRADLASGNGWSDILSAIYPPGSVSGAPKVRALQVISELEPVPRGVYCGTLGFVDADRQRARLCVGIRTFALTSGMLRFGTGAGITWGSDPAEEWQETKLKAARLIGLACS